MSTTIVVVGAGVAGVSAAEALRSEGFPGRIVLLGDEAGAPYARPPLSKHVLEGSWEPHRATLRSEAELAVLDLERRRVRATGLDLLNRRVMTETGPVAYDLAIIATGARAVRPPGIPGIERAHMLRTLEDSLSLRHGFSAARRVAVIGAGILASEIASTSLRIGRETTIIGRSEALSFGSVGTLLHDRLSDLHRKHGVRLAMGTQVRALTPSTEREGCIRLDLDRGEDVLADLVVAATGTVPRTRWLSGSGLTVDDGVLCDASGRAAPDVYAIGDVARWTDPATGASLRLQHQSGAIEQALQVARTIHGHAPEPPPLPFYWSEIHDTRIQVYGNFPAANRLTALEDDGEHAVLASADPVTSSVHGVLGWSAPRAFRRSRALVGRNRRLEPQPLRS